MIEKYNYWTLPVDGGKTLYRISNTYGICICVKCKSVEYYADSEWHPAANDEFTREYINLNGAQITPEEAFCHML